MRLNLITVSSVVKNVDIDTIIDLFENIFAGGGSAYPEDEGPEPLNKRFNWVDPKTGKRPPKPPKAMLPGKEDFAALEPEETPMNVPIKHINPSDTEGRYSMRDLIPPEELANIDHLLDLKLRAQRAQGTERDALEKEWQAHRSEFESLVTRIANIILEGDYKSRYRRGADSVMNRLPSRRTSRHASP